MRLSMKLPENKLWLTLTIVFLAKTVSMDQLAPLAKADQSLCQALISSSLQDKVVLPSSNGTYPGGVNAYFSNQERVLTPLCILRPDTAEDVASIIRTITTLRNQNSDVKFAVRSGGHTPYAGAANIDAGVTIDLRKFNQTVIHPSRKRVTIGAGSTWGDVYNSLGRQGLAVSGGRVAAIGVGGLTLGGGLSFFSPRKGLVCDNVISYDIVLADGAAKTVTQDSDPDLWVALKGGSNNFGIVTSFDVIAFDQGDIFYGHYYYDLSTKDQQLNAFHEIAASPDYDEYASIITSFGFSADKGSAVVNALVYTKPELNPQVLQNFTKIPNLMTTARVTSLYDATVEQGGASSGEFQQLYITTTFKEDLGMLQAGYDIWNQTLSEVGHISGMVWALTYQPLPPIITSKAKHHGGNSLGLLPSKNLVVTQLTASWNKASDNPFVQTKANGFISDFEREARSRGLYNPFKYLNYADSSQDPIGGYGKHNHEKLRGVSRKYDPTSLFQEALPGGFKLFK